jgi:hypothetical protein
LNKKKLEEHEKQGMGPHQKKGSKGRKIKGGTFAVASF